MPISPTHSLAPSDDAAELGSRGKKKECGRNKLHGCLEGQCFQ